MNARRNITACLFMLSLAIPFLSQILLQSEINRVRHEMKEKLEHASLSTVSVPVNEVQWVEKEKEIKINGRLFDVKTQYNENGCIVFIGLYDEEEKALRNVASGQQNPDWLNNLMQKMFAGGYDNFFSGQPVLNIPANRCVPNGTIVIKKHSTPFTAVAAPPPWQA